MTPWRNRTRTRLFVTAHSSRWRIHRQTRSLDGRWTFDCRNHATWRGIPLARSEMTVGIDIPERLCRLCFPAEKEPVALDTALSAIVAPHNAATYGRI